ncbi:sigma-70 family RNA polymerase sigma factor [Demequina sp. NBRC 110051]|uniref:sigma-70 family RNA polymerase sigma factor n=1 Tax=Demequina sp. NBRC 110051 TaxID=1570340 RepID=UPI000A01D75C|nr:sigma-70 family RNA polymerase sigma factor [Demequina sp. NBRC 110051]
MTTEAIALWTETSSDPELIAGVRAGDPAAFGVLYERHVDAARKVAFQYTNSVSDIDDVVSESFSRVLRALQRGDGPDLAFRAYLFTIVRRTGMDVIEKGNRTRPRDDMEPYEAALGYEASSDEPALQGFEQGMVADAYRSLPERWQAVLWYTEIEKKSPKDIAPLLGLSANGVAALAYRAREALRQAYLQQHLSSSVEVSCMEANAQLGSYVRGGLSKREHTRIDGHVKGCERCTALVLELEDVNRGLRGIIAPLFMGALGVGALEGGLPIGGALGPAGATGAAGAGGAGSAAAGAGATTASGVAGAAGTGILGGLGTLGAVGLLTKVAVPAAAALGAVALTVAGVNFIGNLFPGEDPADAQGTGGVASPRDSEPGAGSTDADSGVDSGVDDDADQPAAGTPGSVDESDDATGPIYSAQTGSSPSSVAPVTAPGAGTAPAGSGTAQTTPAIVVDPGATSDDGSTSGGSAGASGTDGTGTADDTSGGTTSGDTGNNTGSGSGTDTGSDSGTDSGTDSGIGTGGDSETPGDGTGEEPGTDTGTDTGTDSGSGTGTDSGTDSGTDTDTGTSGTSKLSIAQSPTSYLALTRSDPEVTLALSNDGDGAAADVTASIALPAGLTFAAPGGTAGFAAPQEDVWSQQMARVTQEPFTLDGWECTLSANARVLTCAIDSVGAGSDASFDMDVTLLTDRLADDATTTFTVDAGAQHVSYSVATGITDLPTGYGATGGAGATQVGATLMGCSEIFDPHRYCKNVMDQTANGDQLKYNNNAYAMVPLNDAGGENNSGTTTVDLPAGATVTSATLEWSANRPVLTHWSGDTGSARLRVPGGHYVEVTADTTRSFTRSLWHYYLSRADVTDLVTGEGTYGVADIALAQSPGTNLYGGFTLTVIYDDPAAPETSSVTVFEGPHWASESTPVTLPFRLDEGRYVTASWTAYETDRGFINDRVALDWSPLRPERERGNGDSGNAGDSTAFGGLYANTLGIDAKPFETVWAQQGAHALKVTTTAAHEDADDSLGGGQRSTGDDFLIGTVVVQTSTEG